MQHVGRKQILLAKAIVKLGANVPIFKIISHEPFLNNLNTSFNDFLLYWLCIYLQQRYVHVHTYTHTHINKMNLVPNSKLKKD